MECTEEKKENERKKVNNLFSSRLFKSYFSPQIDFEKTTRGKNENSDRQADCLEAFKPNYFIN